jgi:hypothetical protein
MPFGTISCNGMSGPCFPKNSKILTDRGYVPIQDIDIIHDTINEQPIVAVVSDIKPISQMILIRPNTYKQNIPNANTLIPYNNKIKLNKSVYLPSRHLDGVNTCQYNFKALGYNLILEGNKGMTVNNLPTESLNPVSDISIFVISELLNIAEERAKQKITKDDIRSKLLNYNTNNDDSIESY